VDLVTSVIYHLIIDEKTLFIIDEFHNLSEVSPKFNGHKIEGMCIENKSGNSYTINLVSDNDNDESTIFKIRIKINN
jgi:hypothetical protein